jgi:hypothetical protein
MNFLELPPEILCEIFSRLRAGAALNFALCSRRSNNIFENEKSNLLTKYSHLIHPCDHCGRYVKSVDIIKITTLYLTDCTPFEGPVRICSRCKIPARRKSMAVSRGIFQSALKLNPSDKISQACLHKYTRVIKKPLASDERYLRKYAISVYIGSHE